MKFNDIIGQEILKIQLLNDIKYNRAAHAYIFDGSDGMGKKFISNIFIQSIMCDNNNACGECPACVKVNTGNHIDIKIFKDNGKKSISIDDMREFFSDLNLRPFLSMRKIYLIENADTINEKCQNMILKTIEEPPAFVTIILLSEALDNILPTIKSRCRILKMQPYSNDQIVKIAGINDKFLLAYAEGNPGMIKKLSQDTEFIDTKNEVINIADKIVKSNSYGSIIQNAEFFNKNSDNKNEILEIMLYIFWDILKYKQLGEKYILNCDNIDVIRNFSKEISYSRLNKIIRSIINTKKDLKYNVNISLTMEKMLLDMV
jgi:DNA polymerase-3 subunit delta'